MHVYMRVFYTSSVCMPVPVHLRACACVCACVYVCVCMCDTLYVHGKRKTMYPRQPNFKFA